jgi:ribonuclease T1
MMSLLAGVALIGATSWLPSEALARRHAKPETDPATQVVALSSLPQPAQEIHRRIFDGGPFMYSKDGDVFGNYERNLPRQPRGFYREYTVPTPGSRDRGARRIVCGGKDDRQPETCFYTQDHYQHFQQIDPQR